MIGKENKIKSNMNKQVKLVTILLRRVLVVAILGCVERLPAAGSLSGGLDLRMRRLLPVLCDLHHHRVHRDLVHRRAARVNVLQLRLDLRGPGLPLLGVIVFLLALITRPRLRGLSRSRGRG